MSDHDLPKPVAALTAEQAANLKFLAHSSHEIRTPLSSVIGFADLLAEGGVEPEEQGRMLAIVSQEAHRLAKVFEQVFRLARLDAGRGTEWNWKAWPAQALFAHVGARAVPETMTPPDIVERGWIEGLTVVCDGDALAAACAALFDNAQRYAGAHAAVSLIAERAELEGRPALRLTVQDSGPGMTEATRQRAFERYFRGELAASAPGSGLGLSLVKLTAELLGGAAALANAPEGGLAASITLPASEASD